MSGKDHFAEWERDFREFLETPASPPPSSVSAPVLERVASDLNPSIWLVAFKLVGVLLVAGPASLLVCPQMGFGADYAPIMMFFMQFGEAACKAGCGAFFMAACCGAACFVLRAEELRVLKNNAFLTCVSISGLGLGAFMCTSPEILLGAALTWLCGAALGGLISIEAGYFIRRKFAARTGSAFSS